MIENLSWGCGVVSSNDYFYYYVGSAIYEFNLHTMLSRNICRMEVGTEVYGPLSITNDGKKIGTYWKHGEEWVVGIVEVLTGEVSVVAAPGFKEPYPIANHSMINPRYDQLVFLPMRAGQTILQIVSTLLIQRRVRYVIFFASSGWIQVSMWNMWGTRCGQQMGSICISSSIRKAR